VQNIKADANKKPFKYASLPYFYRGLVRCEKCGCTFIPEKKKGKYIYYHCTEYHGACNKKWIREEELMKQFAKYFDKIHISEDIVESISNMLRESHQGKANYNKQICQSLQEEYDKLERRIERMYEDFLDRMFQALLTSFAISEPFCDLSNSGHLRQVHISQQFQYALGYLDD
jgi:hypothetical protein